MHYQRMREGRWHEGDRDPECRVGYLASLSPSELHAYCVGLLDRQVIPEELATSFVAILNDWEAYFYR